MSKAEGKAVLKDLVSEQLHKEVFKKKTADILKMF